MEQNLLSAQKLFSYLAEVNTIYCRKFDNGNLGWRNIPASDSVNKVLEFLCLITAAMSVKTYPSENPTCWS